MKLAKLIFLLLPFSAAGQHFGTTTLDIRPMPSQPVYDSSVKGFLGNIEAEIGSENFNWFYWTNYARKDPKRFWDSVVSRFVQTYSPLQGENAVSLKKDLYAASTLPFVKPSLVLIKLAQEHANALLFKKAQPSHTSPNGKTFQTRVEEAGIKKCAGENISFGPSNTLLALVLLYLDQGVSDLGHRKNLMSAQYVEMGVGISAYPNKQVLVVQDFSCDQRE